MNALDLCVSIVSSGCVVLLGGGGFYLFDKEKYINQFKSGQ